MQAPILPLSLREDAIMKDVWGRTNPRPVNSTHDVVALLKTVF